MKVQNWSQNKCCENPRKSKATNPSWFLWHQIKNAEKYPSSILDQLFYSIRIRDKKPGARLSYLAPSDWEGDPQWLNFPWTEREKIERSAKQRDRSNIKKWERHLRESREGKIWKCERKEQSRDSYREVPEPSFYPSKVAALTTKALHRCKLFSAHSSLVFLYQKNISHGSTAKLGKMLHTETNEA